MKKSCDRGNVKSAERALAILEFFDLTRQPASVKDISIALGIPQSSTSMLLKSLVQLGYVGCCATTRMYRPIHRAAFLGSWARRNIREGELSQEIERITQETGETVVIGAQNGPHLQYLYIASARRLTEITPKIGMIRPMTCTAGGRMLLATHDEEKIRAVARRNNSDAKLPVHRVNENDLLAELGRIRLQGYAESKGTFVAGINNISVLTYIDGDSAPLVVGVGGPAHRIEQMRSNIINLLRERIYRPPPSSLARNERPGLVNITHTHNTLPI